jgi:hypothetical protein
MKSIILSIAIILCGALAFAVDFDASAKAGASTETPAALWLNMAGGFDATSGDLRFLGHLGIRTDGVYGGFMGGNYGYGGISFNIVDGGMIYSGDGLSASLGKLEMRDIVDSPYALVLSGRNNDALGASMELHSGRFFYTNRWIALSYDLKNNYAGDPPAWSWPDRSAVVKSWGLDLGAFRVALQDIAVYTGSGGGRSPLFDLDYFVLPLPSFYVQYIGFNEDGPWRKTDRNDNSLTGIMVDWQGEDWYAVGQILIDDINMNRFLNPSGRQNPDKIAWELGLRHKTDIGSFGLYQAGATKYTFEPYGNAGENTMYGYTFSPDVQYEVSGTPMALEPEANYVGYLHGENNVALMGTWRNSYGPVTAAASLEFTLSGSKSPANPWGDLLSWKDGGSGTKLLDESRLEKKLLLGGSVSMPAGSFDLGVEVKLGYVWNRLELEAVPVTVGTVTDPANSPVNSLSIYRPSADSAFIGELVLGAKYRFAY